MTISDKQIQNIKDILEKSHGREFTWQEATQAVRDIQTLARITLTVATEELRREKLLKESPKGFHLDCIGPCEICGTHVSGKNSWFDKYGLKCMICQKAIDDKIIPGSVAKNKEIWYSTGDLASYFNIKGADLTKYVKQSFLKSRIIQNERKRVHIQLFLMKDNKDVLPPKKLLESRTVKIIRNGVEYYTDEQWYEFLDLKLLKRIEKYRILECLKESFAKPMDRGRFLVPKINPIFSFKNLN